MPTYSFKVTKGRYQLSLSTTDREFIVDQFALWVKKASAYVQQKKAREGKDRVEAQISAEREITKRKIDEQLRKLPKPEPVEEQPIEQREKHEQKQDASKNLDIFYAPQNNQNDIQENSGVFDKLLDKSMQTPQTELSFKPSPTIKKDNAFLRDRKSVV